jgi:hypothetical protein
MKTFYPLFVSILITIVIPFAILAADIPRDIGPEIIKLKMGDLYMNFKHWKHQESSSDECFQCHNSNGWKIGPWDKEIAHQICITCHENIKRGPADCKECHTADYTTMKSNN